MTDLDASIVAGLKAGIRAEREAIARETPAERLAAKVVSGATITLDDVAPIARGSHPEGLQFVAVDRAVMRGQEHICTAVSNTFARRIARALNIHKPNSRGV